MDGNHPDEVEIEIPLEIFDKIASDLPPSFRFVKSMDEVDTLVFWLPGRNKVVFKPSDSLDY